MNADRLLALYGRVADAPDAIPRLRRFVLNLAVRGKLVEQDPADKSASELLKRVAVEKARLVQAREIRKPKVLPPQTPESSPFGIPRQWTCARLDELSPRSLTDGDWIETKDQSPDGGIRLVQLADVGVGAFLDKSNRFVTHETAERLKCTRLVAGDVLIARLPNPIGRACIFPDVGQPAITAVDVAILRTDENIAAEYVVVAMNAPSTRNQIEAYGKGATRFRVSTGHLRAVLIPVPPLAEQRRIIAKVNELMVLCDRLERARATRETMREQLTAASLVRLTGPGTNTDAFRTHARFALNALSILTTRPEQIKSLRQTIRSLAVLGRLVKHNPADEPALELLKSIAAEKAQPLQAGKVERDAPVSLEPLPFEFPRHWHPTKLSQVLDELQTGPFGSILHQSDYSVGGTPVINPASIQNERIVPIAKMAVSATTLERLASFTLRSGDIVMARRGEMGRCAVVTAREAGWLCGTGSLILRASKLVSPRFLVLLIGSPFGRRYLSGTAVGSTMQNLNQAILLNLPFGLPPLAEQNRILDKVDALVAVCDRLEASLHRGEVIRGRLLHALLHDALYREVLPSAAEALEAAG